MRQYRMYVNSHNYPTAAFRRTTNKIYEDNSSWIIARNLEEMKGLFINYYLEHKRIMSMVSLDDQFYDPARPNPYSLTIPVPAGDAIDAVNWIFDFCALNKEEPPTILSNADNMLMQTKLFDHIKKLRSKGERVDKRQGKVSASPVITD